MALSICWISTFLGLMKTTPEVLAIVTRSDLLVSSCAYSAVTRMALLGYPNITNDEERLIADTAPSAP